MPSNNFKLKNRINKLCQKLNKKKTLVKNTIIDFALKTMICKIYTFSDLLKIGC